MCECGERFTTTFERFRLRNKRQCNKCGYARSNKKVAHTYSYVKDFIESESKSGCELLSKEYKNNRGKLRIRCFCGKIFVTDFDKFRNRSKRQCNECGYNKISDFFTYDYDHVKTTIEKNSKCKLLSTEYHGHSKPLRFECHCGEEFVTSFTNFTSREGRQCDYCNNLFSVGESRIEEFLQNSNIIYDKQYTFEDLKSDKSEHKLRFDFAIFQDNGELKKLVEYDGRQHYEPIEFFGGEASHEQLKKNDLKKDNYCKLNEIELIRIPYYNEENIEKILTNKLITN